MSGSAANAWPFGALFGAKFKSRINCSYSAPAADLGATGSGAGRMATDKDRISKRLAALSAAKPVAAPAAAPKPKPQKAPRSERRPSFRFGKVLMDNRTELRCVVKDFSEKGARIALEGAFTLSPFVILKVDQTGERRKAAVVWQRESEAGLSFDLDQD